MVTQNFIIEPTGDKYFNRFFFPFSALPEHATLIRAECTFDRDSCAWRNTTTGDFEWRMAAVARRPANLPDKTYGMLLNRLTYLLLRQFFN